jgi:WD40 repeat protein
METHQEAVHSLAFSPDGTRILTGSLCAGTARLWDACTGAEVAVLSGHKDTVNSVAFLPGNTCIVTGSGDGTIRFWDIETGTEIGCVAFDAAVSALAVHPSGVAVGDWLGGVHVLDIGQCFGTQAKRPRGKLASKDVATCADAEAV